MSVQKNIRFPENTMKALEDWMEKNGEKNVSSVVVKAVEKYISEQHVLEPVSIAEISEDGVEEKIAKQMKKHKAALDLLK